MSSSEGGVVSVTVIVVGWETFNPLSMAVIEIVSLPVKLNPDGILTEKLPLLSTVPVNMCPSLNAKLIFVLASAVPIIALSSVVMLFATGFSGGTLSIKST